MSGIQMFQKHRLIYPRRLLLLCAAYLCLAGCACFNLVIMVAFFVFGGYVGYIFTDDPTVVKTVAKLSILAGIYQVGSLCCLHRLHVNPP